MLKGSPKVGVLKVGKSKVGKPKGGTYSSGIGVAPPVLTIPKMRFNVASNSQLLAVLDDF